MSASRSAARIAAIVRADVLIRFRRVSTVVVFLLLSAMAYTWVPDPSTGRALLQITGRRALLNSAAIGMATATLAMMFVGLVGYYVISNALRRDAASRCGFVIASTTVRSGEYLFGKFCGNVLFLVTFTAGFMLTSMAMVLVRGEGPLEPFVFIRNYLILVPPAIVFVSAIAVLFESVRWLSGRIGDVVYFFVWIAGLGIVASLIGAEKAPFWVTLFDFSGFGYLFDTLRATTGTESISIGSSSFDTTKPPVVFRGLGLSAQWAASRIGSTISPLLLLVVARLFFHRFDPVRVRVAAGTGHRGWAARINLLLKPFSRLVALVPWTSTRPSLAGAAVLEARMTLASMPIAIVAILGFAVAALASSTAGVRSGVLPLSLATAALFISDIACRERRAGTLGLAFAAPLIKSRFVAWKLLASLAIVTAFVLAPAVSAARGGIAILPAIVVAILFISATSTALAIASNNSKTFTVLFLTFFYVVMNDKAPPALDFAGFRGVATPAVTVSYAAIAVLATIAAEVAHRARLRREM
ncbi:MAG: hypothetical protein ACYC7A_16200 [Thermoanaerobaculia bacterium]